MLRLDPALIEAGPQTADLERVEEKWDAARLFRRQNHRNTKSLIW
jgi:hypothetical protein